MNRIIVIFIFLIISITHINCGGDESTSTEPSTTGSIKGVISDAETSLPVNAVNVTTRPPTSAVTTDTAGTYSISNVSPEIYSISAEKLGYYTDSVRISVTAGYTTIADIIIKRDTTVSFLH